MLGTALFPFFVFLIASVAGEGPPLPIILPPVNGTDSPHSTNLATLFWPGKDQQKKLNKTVDASFSHLDKDHVRFCRYIYINYRIQIIYRKKRYGES